MTALYVTHDQEEALGMSDRVAVMDRGRIVEVGTPERLYRAPASPSGTSARWSAGAGRSRATARRSRPTDRARRAIDALAVELTRQGVLAFPRPGRGYVRGYLSLAHTEADLRARGERVREASRRGRVSACLSG